MSILSISFRILHRRASTFSIRTINYKPPKCQIRDAEKLVSRNWNVNHKNNYNNLDEPVGALGYILLSIPIVTFILGSWQVNRLRWKKSLVNEIKVKVTSTPEPLPDDLSKLEHMDYCPVKVRGEFLYDREFGIGPKSLIKDGQGVSEKGGGILSSGNNTGYNIITPFKVENRDITILINRGWAPSKPNKLSKAELGHVPGIIEITGIVRLSEKHQALMPHNTPSAGVWINRDVEAMAYMHGTDPIFLDLVSNSNCPNGPIPGQTRVSLRNEHLSYIITWYSLSFLTAWMWRRLYIKKLPLL